MHEKDFFNNPSRFDPSRPQNEWDGTTAVKLKIVDAKPSGGI